MFDLYLKDSAFTAVKTRDVKFYINMVCENGYHLSKEGIRKGYLFREKWYTAKSKKVSLVIGHWAFGHVEQYNDLLE